MSNRRFVRRSEKVNFMELEDGSFARMKNFTSMGEDKNAEEYSRVYVDEDFETVDVTGISTGVSFSMDQSINDPVHEVIVSIFDEEKLGSDSSVTIVSVDFTQKIVDELEGVAYKAKRREFSLIPESEGTEDQAYSYDGTFRVKGVTEHGKAIFEVDKPISLLNEFETFEVI